jgi:hypothetical protein
MRWFGADRARGYSIALLIGMTPFLAYFFWVAFTANADFAGFWSAARLAWRDPALSYDWRATREVTPWIAAGHILPFAYPPPFLLAVAPFGLVPYAVGFVLFGVLGLGVYLAATRSLGALWPSLAFPAVAYSLIVGQNGLLTGGLFLAACSLLDRRPYLAGGLFGLMIVKPQLAILVPVALVCGGRWRAVAGAAAAALGALALSLAVFGSESFAAFLNSIVASKALMFQHAVQVKMQTPFAMALSLGASEPAAAVLQVLAAALAATIVAVAWRSDAATEAKCATLAAAAPFATPYLFGYDLPLLFLPILWLARQDEPLPWERPILGLAFLSPMLATFMAGAGVNLGCLVNAALLSCVARRLRQERRDRGAGGDSPDGEAQGPIVVA